MSSNLTHKNFYSNDSSFSIFNSDSRFFQVSLSYFVHRFLYLNFLSINFLTYRNWNERKSKEIGSVYFKPCLCRIHRLIIIVLLKFVSSFVSNFITVNNLLPPFKNRFSHFPVSFTLSLDSIENCSYDLRNFVREFHVSLRNEILLY